MSDLLKEAIADAKAVRETALQNAKMALEEAFTPQLKNMLSAKLKEDEYGDEEDVVAEPEDDEEVEESTEESTEDPVSEQEGDDEEVEADDEEEVEEAVDEDGDTLDLEAVIRELESELSEGEEEEDDEEEAVEEAEESTEEPVSEVEEPVEEAEESNEESVEEEIDIDENAIEEDEEIDNSNEISALTSELKEYKEAVSFLKDKLHEVNILNAKLLFTNKLFKEYSLNNNQKLKVVETFDRAQTTREIKLVYSTLAEQFGDNGSIARKKSISESASSSVGSTKPSEESRKVITEEAQVANRFKKLAGLIK